MEWLQWLKGSFQIVNWIKLVSIESLTHARLSKKTEFFFLFFLISKKRRRRRHPLNKNIMFYQTELYLRSTYTETLPARAREEPNGMNSPFIQFVFDEPLIPLWGCFQMESHNNVGYVGFYFSISKSSYSAVVANI